MVFTQHFCAACGSEHIRRNDRAGGHAKYQCKGCGHQARFTPAAVVKAVQYAQVDDLLSERNSQRSIARVTGVSRVTIASRIKKRRRLRRYFPAYAPKGSRKRNGRRWNWMKCGRLWANGGEKSGPGWPSSVPAGASWPGGWAGVMRPRPGAYGWRSPRAIAAITGISPTCGRPMWASCPAGTTGAAPKKAVAPASSKPSIVPYADAAASSCGNPAPSVSR